MAAFVAASLCACSAPRTRHFTSEEAVVARPAPQPAAPKTLAAAYDKIVSRIVAEANELDRAHDLLRHLCLEIGPRLSGSVGLERALSWSKAELQAAGHERVRIEKVLVPKWVRGEESLSIVETGVDLELLGLGGSVGTKPQGVVGELLVVDTFDELAAHADSVKGRIVLFNHRLRLDAQSGFPEYPAALSFRLGGASAAGKLGAAAVLVRSITTDVESPPHTGRLDYAPEGARIPAAAVSYKDADLLEARFKEGTPTTLRLQMQARSEGEVESGNELAELRGSELPEEIVLISAHIDSWDIGHGAHDNGAGVVSVMAALGVLRRLELRPRRTIRLVLWTNEENGLRGAAAYAKSHGSEQHVAAVESDSGGAPIFALSLQAGPKAAGLETLGQLSALLAQQGVTHVMPFFAGEDIQPLINRGVPGVGLWRQPTHYFDFHHSAADVFASVDASSLRQNVAVTASTIFVLADMPGTLGL